MTAPSNEDQAVAAIPASCTCEWCRAWGGRWKRTVPKADCPWHSWEWPE